MIKVALIVVFSSTLSTENKPEISVSGFYKSISECQNKLDQIKNIINVEEIIDNNQNRMLKFRSREMHQQGFIYWACKEKE